MKPSRGRAIRSTRSTQGAARATNRATSCFELSPGEDSRQAQRLETDDHLGRHHKKDDAANGRNAWWGRQAARNREQQQRESVGPKAHAMQQPGNADVVATNLRNK